jgi:hypothetical protein
VRAKIAGEINDAEGLETVRANVGLLFERFEIARACQSAPARREGSRRGTGGRYWREILGRVPSSPNEPTTSVSD